MSTHALAVRDVIRGMGLESEIYVKESRGEMLPEARFYRTYAAAPDDVLLYQAATGSVVADYLLDRPEPLIVNYHNLTPPRFFAPWEPHTAVELSVGLRQMRDLGARASMGIAVSKFNERDLVEMGFAPTAVAPLLLDVAMFDRAADATTLDRLGAAKQAGGADFLFVGRLAPNKAQHDLVKAFAAYRQVYEPHARLRLVGSPSSPRYQRALRGFVATLGLADAVDLAGEVSDAELAAYYRSADVFVCLSEHEGFCAPVLEAMHHDLPIVAFAAGAVPETIGDAGVILPEKDPATVAAALHRVVSDGALAGRLVAAGRRRLAEFSLERSTVEFRTVLARTLDLVAA